MNQPEFNPGRLESILLYIAFIVTLALAVTLLQKGGPF
jgi:hypothetical protein